jgi:hypothetical protein
MKATPHHIRIYQTGNDVILQRNDMVVQIFASVLEIMQQLARSSMGRVRSVGKPRRMSGDTMPTPQVERFGV